MLLYANPPKVKYTENLCDGDGITTVGTVVSRLDIVKVIVDSSAAAILM